MKYLIALIATISLVALVGCEKGPSGVNPSLELDVINNRGVAGKFYANFMAHGSDFMQANLPFDSTARSGGVIEFLIARQGLLQNELRNAEKFGLLSSNMEFNIPTTVKTAGSYSLDSVAFGSTTRNIVVTVNLDGILYTSTSGTMVIQEVDNSGYSGTLYRLKGYFSGELTGFRVLTGGVIERHTLTISSCLFNTLNWTII